MTLEQTYNLLRAIFVCLIGAVLLFSLVAVTNIYTTAQQAPYYSGDFILANRILSPSHDLGLAISDNGSSGFIDSQNIPSNGIMIGAGEFNGDGKKDMLFIDFDGYTIFNFTQNNQILSTHLLPAVSADWKVYALGDMNDDGITDIFWRNRVSGDVAVWTIGNNSQLINGYFIYSGLDLDWNIVGFDDITNTLYFRYFGSQGGYYQTHGQIAAWKLSSTGQILQAANTHPQYVDNNWKFIHVEGNKIYWDGQRLNGTPTVAIWDINPSSLLLQSSYTANVSEFDNYGMVGSRLTHGLGNNMFIVNNGNQGQPSTGARVYQYNPSSNAFEARQSVIDTLSGFQFVSFEGFPYVF